MVTQKTPTISDGTFNGRLNRANGVNIERVLNGRSGVFGRPITRRLTEYSAVSVNIPDSSAGILSFVCKMPVKSPANIPQSVAARIARYGEKPFVTILANTDAPRTIEPSTLRSAMFSMRNEMNTPSTIIAQNKPKETAPVITSGIPNHSDTTAASAPKRHAHANIFIPCFWFI
jgi:hypothetical protein